MNWRMAFWTEWINASHCKRSSIVFCDYIAVFIIANSFFRLFRIIIDFICLFKLYVIVCILYCRIGIIWVETFTVHFL